MIAVVARHRTMHLGTPSSGPGRLFADPDFEAKLATIRAWQLSCTPAAVPPMVYPPPVLPWLPPPPI